MWNQEAFGENPSGSRAAEIKRGTLQILPCSVSQLLLACPSTNKAFTICDLELNQVSVVGVVRSFSPCATYELYFVDDMTGPPLPVKRWINTEGGAGPAPALGSYVKVHGTLQIYQGERSLLAMDIRSVKDCNEITSHMLEVVQAHLELFGKSRDVNMNALLESDVNRCSESGFSTIQGQVMHVIRQHSQKQVGISFQDLATLLDYIGLEDIRKSLTFLINEGHVFSTIDENHFKSTEH